MQVSQGRLVNEFVQELHEGDAAIFAGAGLSRASGFVDWRGLLRECAQEIGLDLDQEYDLVAVAQYYLNLGSAHRYKLNDILLRAFRDEGELTDNHRLIARLPLHTLWTTNYDTLIEQAFHEAGRRLEVKSRDEDIGHRSRRRDAVLYKMHGDIARPEELVICKADYERYARQHALFQTTLEADLASKTMLFIGFSFSDPNLNYMLGHLHAISEGNMREHFAILRRVRENRTLPEGERERALKYDVNKQELQLRELERYNIHALLISQFDEVTDLLRAIQVASCRRNVFVSGSASSFAEDFDEQRLREFCLGLGERMMDHGFKLVTGLGLNVGDTVFQGALLRLHEQKKSGSEHQFVLRPFPRSSRTKDGDNPDAERFLEGYREDMIAEAGIVVVISGTSRSAAISRGVMQEYQIAARLGKPIVPIGASGHAARQVWEELRERRATLYRGLVSAEQYERLGDARASDAELLNVTMDVLDRLSSIQ